MKLIFLFLLPLALGMEPEPEPAAAAAPVLRVHNTQAGQEVSYVSFSAAPPTAAAAEPEPAAPLPPDYTYGDEELDNWVRDTYGNEYDWVLISEIEDQHSAHQLLPEFRVVDDDGDFETGIAIMHRDIIIRDIHRNIIIREPEPAAAAPEPEPAAAEAEAVTVVMAEPAAEPEPATQVVTRAFQAFQLLPSRIEQLPTERQQQLEEKQEEMRELQQNLMTSRSPNLIRSY
eukprot:SAG11_NODE_2392_length_3410_cov_20.904259_4_plen_229_part_01